MRRAFDKTIPEIQGSGTASLWVNCKVRTTGIVTGSFQGNDELRGFFLQTPTGDGSEVTSDGIFVFAPDSEAVSVGDNL